MEWVDTFREDSDPISSLENVLTGDVAIDDDSIDGLHVLCAAEALVAILHRPRDGCPLYFDDPSTLEAGAVRLKPRCLQLLRQLLGQASALRSLWIDQYGNVDGEWTAEVNSLIDDLENA
jgi:hypothetical protein